MSLPQPPTMRSAVQGFTIRGFTMVELAAGIAILGLLTLLVAVGSSTIERLGRDSQATIALEGVAAAQQLRHDTFGSFTATPERLEDMVAGLQFVDGSVASTGASVLSVALGTEGGFDLFAVAVRASSGRCYVLRAHESASSTTDVRRVYDDLPAGNCSGGFALSAAGGDGW